MCFRRESLQGGSWCDSTSPFFAQNSLYCASFTQPVVLPTDMYIEQVNLSRRIKRSSDTVHDWPSSQKVLLASSLLFTILGRLSSLYQRTHYLCHTLLTMQPNQCFAYLLPGSLNHSSDVHQSRPGSGAASHEELSIDDAEAVQEQDKHVCVFRADGDCHVPLLRSMCGVEQ